MTYTEVLLKIMKRMAERSEFIDTFLGAMIEEIPGGLDSLKKFLEERDEEVREGLIAVIQIIKEEAPELLSVPGEDLGKD